MENYQMTYEGHPDSKDVQFLEDQINAFNFACTPYRDGGLLAFFVRDTNSNILAGVYGWTWGECLEIAYLWVREDLRRSGFGSKLLHAAEQEAIKRGCHQALLDTHSFQAPEFYQKHGYEIFGVLDNYPTGYKKYYLKKNLR